MVQHVKVEGPEAVHRLISAVLGPLPRFEKLYPGSPGVYRRRWNELLKALLIEERHKLTPGSLRGGGAVAAHGAGTGIDEVQWRLRVRSQGTLSLPAARRSWRFLFCRL